MFKGNSTLDKEQILDVYTEEQLFHYYCSNFKLINVSFLSDSRTESSPSCRIAYVEGKLKFKDFGDSFPATDVWGYVGRKYSLSYTDTLKRIYTDLIVKPVLNLPNTQGNRVKAKQTQLAVNEKIRIRIKRRYWNNDDYRYWYERYQIPLPMLEEYNIYPISDYWLNTNMLSVHYAAEKLSYCYTYYYHDDLLLRKIYQPLSKNAKWKSNIDNTVVQGIANIPKFADLLIITSSMKDILVLKLMGYPSVSPNNEMSWLSDSVWTKFQSRYKQIVLLHNTDAAGIISAARLSYYYNIPFITIPLDYNKKDPSDLLHSIRNIEKTKSIIATQLNMLYNKKKHLIKYKIVKDNRVQEKTGVFYEESPKIAEQTFTKLLEHFNVRVLDCVAQEVTNI